jgi:type VI secretion system protein
LAWAGFAAHAQALIGDSGMHSRTLLQRLIEPDKAPASTRISVSEVMESVLEHLARMFNVRQGAVSTRPDYGMPDFNDLVMQFPAAIPAISRAIKQQIDRFEPRLSKVVVRHVPEPDQPLSLYFQISAELEVPDHDERVSFETVFGGDGSVRIR